MATAGRATADRPWQAGLLDSGHIGLGIAFRLAIFTINFIWLFLPSTKISLEGVPVSFEVHILEEKPHKPSGSPYPLIPLSFQTSLREKGFIFPLLSINGCFENRCFCVKRQVSGAELSFFPLGQDTIMCVLASISVCLFCLFARVGNELVE